LFLIKCAIIFAIIMCTCNTSCTCPTTPCKTCDPISCGCVIYDSETLLPNIGIIKGDKACVWLSKLDTAYAAILQRNIELEALSMKSTNFPTGALSGVLGSSAMVDSSVVWTVNQTTAAQVFTLPTPTDVNKIRTLKVCNTGTESFTIETLVLTINSYVEFMWANNTWNKTL
jgi:hypothetical protein